MSFKPTILCVVDNDFPIALGKLTVLLHKQTTPPLAVSSSPNEEEVVYAVDAVASTPLDPLNVFSQRRTIRAIISTKVRPKTGIVGRPFVEFMVADNTWTNDELPDGAPVSLVTRFESGKLPNSSVSGNRRRR